MNMITLIILDDARMTIKQYVGHNPRWHAAVEQLEIGPQVLW